MPDPIEHHVLNMIELLGENVQREGLADTPRRMAKALREMTSGYAREKDLEAVATTFPNEGYDQLIAQFDVPVRSLCEHHVLPFVGYAHIGYVPDKTIIGLSKFARIVDCYARRLQVQERLTEQVASFLEKHLEPLGVMVVLDCDHSCMSLRGVQAPGTRTMTSAVRGFFRDPNENTRQEFLELLAQRRRQ